VVALFRSVCYSTKSPDKKTELDTCALPACPFFSLRPRQANAGNDSPVRGREARRPTCTARCGTRRSGTCPGTRCSLSRLMGYTAPPTRSPRTTRSTGSRSPPTPTTSAPQEKPMQRKNNRGQMLALNMASSVMRISLYTWSLWNGFSQYLELLLEQLGQQHLDCF
jgi:hypothetical protein